MNEWMGQVVGIGEIGGRRGREGKGREGKATTVFAVSWVG